MDTHRFPGTFAFPAVAALALSSCASGGYNGTAPGTVPQTSTARTMSTNARSAGKKTFLAQGVSNGIARIAKTHELRVAPRKGKRPNDYTQPSNTTTADPPVPRPNESPCTVTLFSGFQFTNFTYPTFQYAPPATCPGPWAKVVFEGDFSVNAGRQFDRTGSIWIAGTNIYFGTTAEPSANRGPSWHVERDLTDLSAILTAPSTGEVVLGNVVDSTYTGVITASATLQFYPANAANPAPTVADDVYPLSGGPLGDNQYPSSQQQPLTGTFTLPRNVEAAYLDVYLQSQIGDEFWYTCFPNDLAAQIPNCGNTAFREGEVAVDGRPAGVVPVYPWIFTGGIDPYLWRPIPGVETLEFRPYRVNLTPFAALLDDGNPHIITVNVFNNGNYFAAN
ncbi:MAG TPA: peptide-N4-asparagine amidase, partial [Candidatus Acidoferrales bacterium]|nr:peptide-N4-asparagine amidase [Candidatus Acidoferrales bacterium]